MWFLAACVLQLATPPGGDDSILGDTGAADSEDTGTEPVVWPTLACDTGVGAILPATGTDTGACPGDSDLATALAEIPDPADTACAWTAPVDTAVGVVSGCGPVPDADDPPPVDTGCIVQTATRDGALAYEETFDADGRVVAYNSDEIGARYYYDAYGNRVVVDEFWYGVLTWQYVYAYTYDAGGHALAVAVYLDGSLYDETTYSYDEDGRLATACNDRPYTETYTWTDDGQLASYGYDGADPDPTDGGGWFTYVIDYAYDEEGRLTGEYDHWVYDSWGGVRDTAWAWTYDADGNRVHQYTANDCAPWTLDQTWEYVYDTDCGATVTDDGTRYHVLRFDADGRLIEDSSHSYNLEYSYTVGDCPC